MAEVISVSVLNRYVKTLLDTSDVLFDLALRGEIANFVQNSKSGHCYFSLRDEASSVRAVMFKTDARRLAFRPQEGMRVIVRCRATLYERDGAFQIYVNEMFPDGIGSMQLAFEQLKEKLAREGLFDPAHKKPIPTQPGCIGVVTSKTGAALQDILQVTSRRWPLAKILLCPVGVQGFEAAGQIAAAIDTLDRSKRADVIIVARGGGSREDLWVFNAEVIARAAYRCKTPLISAIGHEIDFTILDFVADLRAPTPSAAAELAVPDVAELRQRIFNLRQNIHKNMQNRLQICYNELDGYPQQFFFEQMQQHHAEKKAALHDLQRQLGSASAGAMRMRTQRLSHAAALAASLSPYHTLARGYTLLQTEDGTVTTADRLQPGQKLLVAGVRHTAHCLVETVEENTIYEDPQKL